MSESINESPVREIYHFDFENLTGTREFVESLDESNEKEALLKKMFEQILDQRQKICELVHENKYGMRAVEEESLIQQLELTNPNRFQYGVMPDESHEFDTSLLYEDTLLNMGLIKQTRPRTEEEKEIVNSTVYERTYLPKLLTFCIEKGISTEKGVEAVIENSVNTFWLHTQAPVDEDSDEILKTYSDKSKFPDLDSYLNHRLESKNEVGKETEDRL